MMELAATAKPGPFGPRTFMLGRHIGYRDGGRLLAMGGERFRAPRLRRTECDQRAPGCARTRAGRGHHIASRPPSAEPGDDPVPPRVSRQPGRRAVPTDRLSRTHKAVGDLAARHRPDAIMDIAAIRPVFFGWKVVATAFTVATFTFGVGYYGPSVFLNVLHQEHGWSVSVISWAITVHFLVSAILVARLPDAHRRFGVASVTLAGVAVLAIGMFLLVAGRRAMATVRAAILSGCGWAATSGAAIIAMVSPWFDRRRAMALGQSLSMAPAPVVSCSPRSGHVIAAIGFGHAVAAVGVVMLAILGPVGPALSAHAPRSWSGSGRRPGATAGPTHCGNHHQPATVAVLLADRNFTTLSIAFALGMFAQVGVTTHLVTRLVPRWARSMRPPPWASPRPVRSSGGCCWASCPVMRTGASLRPATSPCRRAACRCLPWDRHGSRWFRAASCSASALAAAVAATLIAQRVFAETAVPRVVALVTAVNQAVFASCLPRSARRGRLRVCGPVPGCCDGSGFVAGGGDPGLGLVYRLARSRETERGRTRRTVLNSIARPRRLAHSAHEDHPGRTAMRRPTTCCTIASQTHTAAPVNVVALQAPMR